MSTLEGSVSELFAVLDRIRAAKPEHQHLSALEIDFAHRIQEMKDAAVHFERQVVAKPNSRNGAVVADIRSLGLIAQRDYHRTVRGEIAALPKLTREECSEFSMRTCQRSPKS
jgi:hypothetical protein